MAKILVVEDDAALNKAVCAFIRRGGHEAIGCLGANDAYDALYENTIDCIVSDIMMPGADGFEFAAAVRETDKKIPILFITARDDMPSKKQGFAVGIDDYMVKPVDMEELLLRIGALLRRAGVNTSRILTVGALSLDADIHTATLNGEDIPLTVREFDILHKLLSYPKKTFTRIQLMDEFWGVETTSSPRTVDVFITKLRNKLAACGDFEIVSVYGLGYKAVIK